MQAYLREQYSHPPSDLDETNTQGIELQPARTALYELPPQGVHQPVGAHMQQQPELVGDEAVATEAIGFDVELEVLDPVLALPALGVELVKLLGGIVPGADEETPVGPLL